MTLGIEILFILLLIFANGIFAMAEIAVIAAKKTKLKKLADTGDPGAKKALELATSPNRFLATVQVGITLIGVMAGAFGGATLAQEIAKLLSRIPILATHSGWLSVAIVVAIITFFSLVIGELVPKRIGLSNPEGIARALARPLDWLSRIATPLVTALSASTDAALRLGGFKHKEQPPVSEDEVRTMVEQGLRAGVFHRIEHELVERAFQLDELTVHDLRTPRSRIVWLKLDDFAESNWRKVVTSGHTQFPVYQGNRDNVIGIVSVKALFANLALAGAADLKNLVTEAPYVPSSMHATKLLELFKQSGKHVALVTDEFGGIEGLVTVTDVMEAIVGEVPSHEKRNKRLIAQREDGSWLAEAYVDIDELKRILQIRHLPGEESEEYQTLGGFILNQLGRIPNEGEYVEAEDLRFEVIDMDRQRIDKVLITPAKTRANVVQT
jgi:putative hemolysin